MTAKMLMLRLLQAANFRLDRVSERILSPWMVRMGWQPSGVRPVDEVQLKTSFGYDDELAIKAASLRVLPNTMASFHRLATLWLQIGYLDRNSIDGSLVECGVWKGGTSGLMALAHMRSRNPPTRELHMFDSWKGLPEPQAGLDGTAAGDYAGGRASGALESIGQCVSSLDDAANLLERRIGYPRELLHYHQGWFQDTIAREADSVGEIALLRLDGDWYESTKLSLEHLYPKVSKYGVVVIDDYGHWEGCRKAVDEYISTLAEPVLLNRVDYSCRYWVKSSR